MAHDMAQGRHQCRGYSCLEATRLKQYASRPCDISSLWLVRGTLDKLKSSRVLPRDIEAHNLTSERVRCYGSSVLHLSLRSAIRHQSFLSLRLSAFLAFSQILVHNPIPLHRFSNLKLLSFSSLFKAHSLIQSMSVQMLLLYADPNTSKSLRACHLIDLPH